VYHSFRGFYFSILEDVRDVNGFLCEGLFLYRPQVHVLLNVILILLAERQVKVIEELVADVFLLKSDLLIHSSFLLILSFLEGLFVILLVIFLKVFQFSHVEKVLYAWAEHELAKLRHALYLLKRLSKQRKELN